MCSAYIFLFLLNWISCCIFSFFGVNWTYGRLSSTRYFGLLLLKRAVCVCVYVCVVFLFLSFLYISHASYFPCKISVSWRLLAENKLSKSTERLVFFQGCPNSLFFFFLLCRLYGCCFSAEGEVNLGVFSASIKRTAFGQHQPKRE